MAIYLFHVSTTCPSSLRFDIGYQAETREVPAHRNAGRFNNLITQSVEEVDAGSWESLLRRS